CGFPPPADLPLLRSAGIESTAPNREGGQLMNLADLRARMRRLATLVNGLGQEESLWRKCGAPVLAVDREAYMKAINEAIHGLETARVTLAKMCRELESGNS